MKRLFKVIVAIIASVIMLQLSALINSIHSEAASEPELCFSFGDVRQGDEFTGTLYFSEGSNVNRMAITLFYDSSVVDFVSCSENENSPVTVFVNSEKEGQISVSFVSTRNITSELKLLDIRFKVFDDLSAGSYNFIGLSNTENSVSRLINNVVENVAFKTSFDKLDVFRSGDINMDGIVDGIDAVYILRYEVGLDSGIDTPDSFYLPYHANYEDYTDHQKFILGTADAYFDGVIDGSDAVSILRHEVGFNEALGNRIDIDYCDNESKVISTRCLEIGHDLIHIPDVPARDGYQNGRWSLSAKEYIKPDFANLASSVSLFAYYDEIIVIPDDVLAYNSVIAALDTVFPSENSCITSGFKLPYKNSNVAYNIPTKGNFDSVEITWYLETSSTGEGMTDYISTVDYTCVFKNSDGSYVFDYTTWVDFTAHIWINGVQYEDCVYSRKVLGSIDIPDSSAFSRVVNNVVTSLTFAEEGDSLPGYISLESERLTKKINGVQHIDIDWVVVAGDPRGFNTKTNTFVSLANDNTMTLRYAFVFDNHVVFGGDNASTVTITVPAKSHEEQVQYAENYLSQYVPSVLSGTNLFPTTIDLYDLKISWISGSPSGKINTNFELYNLSNTLYQRIGVGPNAGYMDTGCLIATITQKGEEFCSPISFNLLIAGESDDVTLENGKIHDENLYKALLDIYGVSDGYGRLKLTEESLSQIEKLKNSNYSLNLSNKNIHDLTGIEYVKGLRALNLSGNDLSGSNSNITKIKELTYLVQLDLSNCGISEIPEVILSRMYYIEGIDLSYNNIENLDFINQGRSITSLKYLFVHENPVVNIDGLMFVDNSGNALSSAPNLKQLTLNRSGESEVSLDISALAYTDKLSILWLKNQKIDDISILASFKYLSELDLSGNNITTNGLASISNIASLTTLLLDNNKITSLRPFNNKLVNLRVLSLSGNSLGSVGNNLNKMVKLEYLDLDNNRIPSFDVSCFTNLKYLFLENNELEFLYNLVENGDETVTVSIPNILELRLNGNRIRRSQIECISFLTTLEYLSLSGNDVGNLKFLSNLSNLRHLELANTNLDQVEYREETENSEEGEEVVQKTISVDYDNLSNLFALINLEELDLSNNSKLYTIDGFINSKETQTGGLTSDSSGLRNLKVLLLDNINLNTAETVSNMPKLMVLSMQNSGVKDVLFTRTLKSLKYLNLSGHNSQIIDFSRVEWYEISQLYLDSALERTSVSALDNLENMTDLEYLSLKNLDIKSIDSIPVIVGLKYLNIAGTSIPDLFGSGEDDYYPHSIAHYSNLKVLDVSDNDKIFTYKNLNLLYDLFKDIVVYLYDDHTITGFDAEREIQYVNRLALMDYEWLPVGGNIVDYRNTGKNGLDRSTSFNGFDIDWTIEENDYVEISDNVLSVVSIYIEGDEIELMLTGHTNIYNQVPCEIKIPVKFSTNAYSIKYILDSEENSFSKRIALNDSRNVFEYEVGDDIVFYDPTRGEYDYFLGWYDEEGNRFENDLMTNPRNIELFARWDVATYYDSIDELPLTTSDSRIVIDWTTETNFDFSSHFYSEIPGVRENRESPLYIGSSTERLIFIGSGKLFSNFGMKIECTDGVRDLDIDFINFRFDSNKAAAIETHGNGSLNLNITVSGDCHIGSTYGSGNIIGTKASPIHNLTITGTGLLEIIAGNGNSGTTAGSAGSAGGVGIYADNLSFDVSGSVSVKGGNGGSGMSGTTGVGGGKGGDGGFGGSAIICDTVSITTGAGQYSIISGNGGAGAQGVSYSRTSNAYGYASDGRHGGAGGAGGYSGIPIHCNSIVLKRDDQQISSNEWDIAIISGNGGDGGSGGNGEFAGYDKNPSARAGNGGTGGRGGNSVPINYGIFNSVDEGVAVKIVMGKGGKGGDGGSGGHSDEQYVIFKVKWSFPGSGGSGGAGGTVDNSHDLYNPAEFVPGSAGGKGSSGSGGTADYY